MTRCRRRSVCVVSVPLRAFARSPPGVGAGWEPREAEGRPGRTDRGSRRAPAAGSRSSARGRDLCTRAAAAAPELCALRIAPSQRHFERPRQRRRETDRQSDLPLFPPPQLRSRAHKGRRGDAGAGGWFSSRGLDSSCVGGWRGKLPTVGRGRGGRWTEERDPELMRRPPGGRGESAVAVSSAVARL